MKSSKITVNLVDLKLDPNNPRIERCQNEIEAYKALWDSQGDKIVDMMQHISEHWLSPNHTIGVIKNTDNVHDYIVKDGNRRITALKTLYDLFDISHLKASYQSKISKAKKALEKNFGDLSKTPNLEVVLYPNLETAHFWMMHEHAETVTGVKKSEWSVYHHERFKEYLRVPTLLGYQYIRTIEKNVKENELNGLNQLKNNITTLDRVFKSKYAEEKLGLINKDGFLYSKYNPESTTLLLKTFANKFCSTNQSSRTLNKQKDIEKFLEETILSELELDKLKLNESGLLKISELKAKATQKKSRKKKAKSGGSGKTKVIPQNFHLPDEYSPKIVEMTNELKKLSVKSYRLSAAISLRTYYELLLDEYVDACKPQGIKRRSPLKDKMRKAIEHLEGKGVENDVLAPAKSALDDDYKVIAFDNFHQYVHSKFFTPEGQSLIDTWNNLSGFFQELIELVRQKKEKQSVKK